MSFEEKGKWLYAVIAVVLPAIYFATIIPQLSDTAVADIEYQGPLLLTIGAAIVLTIAGMIVIGISSPDDAGTSDQRDKEIDRFGEYVGGFVLALGMIVPFALALAEFQQFWIANAMYLAFSLAAVVGTTAKLVAYRRGL